MTCPRCARLEPVLLRLLEEVHPHAGPCVDLPKMATVLKVREALAPAPDAPATAPESVTVSKAEWEAMALALAPFANYAKQRGKQPLLGLGGTIHRIHTGSEYEAAITLEDCKRALTVLDAARKGGSNAAP